MNILKTNINDNDWNMELAFNLFESDERIPMKYAAGKTLTVSHYVIYEDENSNGDMVKLASIATEDGVYTTSSASFIRSLEKLHDLAERCGEPLKILRVYEQKSNRNGRMFLNCAYVK